MAGGDFHRHENRNNPDRPCDRQSLTTDLPLSKASERRKRFHTRQHTAISRTPLENMAATRLTFDILLPNLWSVNELRVARDLLGGPGLPHQTASPFFF